MLITGLLSNLLFLGKFIASISQKPPQNLNYSPQLLIHSQTPPNLFTLNTMIRAHSKGPTPHHSFHFYRQILHSSLPPDKYTFTFLVRTCATDSSSGAGPTVHGAVMHRGFGADAHVQSGLIHMDAELGSFGPARLLFLEIAHLDLVTQTTMVGACAGSGDIEFARELFDEMPHRDPIAWNTMIKGYAHRGKSREALHLFNLMQLEGVTINEATLVSVLSVCAHLGALDQGRCAHIYIERNRLQMTVTLGTALIDIYSKVWPHDQS